MTAPLPDYHRGRLVRLRSDKAKRAEAHAEKTGTTVPAIVDRALGEFLDRHDTDKPEEST